VLVIRVDDGERVGVIGENGGNASPEQTGSAALTYAATMVISSSLPPRKICPASCALTANGDCRRSSMATCRAKSAKAFATTVGSGCRLDTAMGLRASGEDTATGFGEDGVEEEDDVDEIDADGDNCSCARSASNGELWAAIVARISCGKALSHSPSVARTMQSPGYTTKSTVSPIKGVSTESEPTPEPT
jgi:hypothetical protein